MAIKKDCFNQQALMLASWPLMLEKWHAVLYSDLPDTSNQYNVISNYNDIYEVLVSKKNFSMNLTDSDSSCLKITFEIN